MSKRENVKSKELICLGLTEQGKIHALRNDHPEALRHFREALRVAMQCKNNEIFFLHTTQCIMESLELSGSYNLVCEYCERSEEHFSGLEISDPVLIKQRASNLERLGLAKLQADEVDEAREILDLAVLVAGAKAMPLAETVLGWLRRGLSAQPQQIRVAQRRHNYFVIRKGEVREDIAIQLPDEMQPQTAVTLRTR